MKSRTRRLAGWLPCAMAVWLGGCRPSETTIPEQAPPIVTPVRRYAVEWVSAGIPGSMRRRATLSVPVSFRNTGDRVLPVTFALSYHWYRSGDREDPAVWDGVRTVIARDVSPGEVYEGEMTLQSPAQPGGYELALDVVQEGVAWFSARGVPMSFHPVRVD
ncbi:MAG: hypothetical protein ABR576_11760 [Thermoanaerobaculia bacterium]